MPIVNAICLGGDNDIKLAKRLFYLTPSARAHVGVFGTFEPPIAASVLPNARGRPSGSSANCREGSNDEEQQEHFLKCEN
jgi:hypothetical protein